MTNHVASPFEHKVAVAQPLRYMLEPQFIIVSPGEDRIVMPFVSAVQALSDTITHRAKAPKAGGTVIVTGPEVEST
jgi:hypothetical protein